MEQSEPAEILFTTKCFNPKMKTALSEHEVLSCSRTDPSSSAQPDNLEGDPKPVVEIVTVVSTFDIDVQKATSGKLWATPDYATSNRVRGRHLIVHSETLSKAIRDVVKFYPGQILTGTCLVIHEPYACLMHNMRAFEHILESEEDAVQVKQLEVLLKFLRPHYQRQFVAARNRLSSSQPTVRFDDIWVLMKPGSLAYTKWDGQWLGCVIGKSTKLPPRPADGYAQRWSIEYWFLQVHWPSDQIRFATNSAVIDQFEGEQLVTSLPVYPAEFQDANDNGQRKRKLTERGQKTCEILWDDSRYMSYLGPPGVGKSYTVEYTSMKTQRPLIVISAPELNRSHDNTLEVLKRWFSFGEEWNAIFLIDKCDETFNSGATDRDQVALKQALTSALKLFNGLLFLITSKISDTDNYISSFIDLVIHFERLDKDRRCEIWPGLVEQFYIQDKRIVASQNATELLTQHVSEVNMNGHEMVQCFKTATALANSVPTKRNRDGSHTVTVKAGHFKEAINLIYEFRQSMLSKAGDEEAMVQNWHYRNDETESELTRKRPSPGAADKRLFPHIGPTQFWRRNFEESDDDDFRPWENSKRPASLFDKDANAGTNKPFASPTGQPRSNPGMLAFRQPQKLCIPSLNCVEWDAFRAAGNTNELFRHSQYYSIDVLVGEPMIKMETDGKGRRRRNKAPCPTKMASDAVHYEDDGEAPLPERIRINSPFLITIISNSMEGEIQAPFLIFRPFRSLIYHAQGYQDCLELWDPSAKPGAYGVGVDQSSYSGLASRELRCLMSFVDNYIKKKQHYIASERCKSVAFTDLTFLYIPGDIVVTNDGKQAARVTKVASTRHRVKNRDEGGLDFWKDNTMAEFDDNPVFVFVNYVDFNGTSLGSVSKTYTFSRSYFDRKVDGREKITSLPIYPLRCSEDLGLRDALIERGRMFLEVARVKHMHYSGLALGTKEEIDSQVVIDFEEAIERHPKWRPCFRRAGDEALNRLTKWESDSSDDKELVEAVATHRRSRTSQCVKECCLNEMILNDEDLEDQVMEEFIVGQMDETSSLAFTTKPLKEIGEHTVLLDEDYLIMSFRVFGFALRSRKWYELDLTNMTEVATLGEGEGLDQLVLPPGHVDMVKSMIRQHFRDKTLATSHGDKLDVVRRGLIILLHGVPGVGKTSTAECVADSFRRPLFQITSGDLGTTAQDVEQALEENFNLASRWNSILLIDEADVFLGERTRDDFVRNSLVAVFLRMMEYYTGVLFLTTNRVGVFDEAFTSRIHISLYYPPLERDATIQIFQKNWARIQSRYEKNNRKLEINQPEITQFAMDYFDANKDGRWNGRQIRNAFQSALALAELDALGTDDLLDEADHDRGAGQEELRNRRSRLQGLPELPETGLRRRLCPPGSREPMALRCVWRAQGAQRPDYATQGG
ncbi:hypothetical protein PG991_001812 [Apiospora marii]|uniref:AAA+ ATPase domain-containing protein n=2 Tax=Apiospora marii TaxID=335849 RepID=A0ABR1SN53_9PEZI